MAVAILTAEEAAQMEKRLENRIINDISEIKDDIDKLRKTIRQITSSMPRETFEEPERDYPFLDAGNRIGETWSNEEENWVYEQWEENIEIFLKEIAERIGRTSYAVTCRLKRMNLIH